MHHPYQCVKTLAGSGGDSPSLLLAASGSRLYCVSLVDGAILSRWPAQDDEIASEEDREDDAPPSKRQKISEPTPEPANIIKLEVDSVRRRLFVVTAEDKKIHVFEVSLEGQLTHLSERSMPKRPSALAISPDGSSIYAGDKFGDVYALPTLGKQGDEPVPANVDSPSTPKPKGPAATDKTVHSKANLRTLQAQLKQAEQGGPVKTKEPLDFEHQLVLGHVSMLTDLLCVRTSGPDHLREYIITADRDEHIRVSRSGTQAHIIENFCLGHKEFISKLCVFGDRLYSGGGDDELYVWSWQQGYLIGKIDLKSHLPEDPTVDISTAQEPQTETSKSQITVTGITTASSPDQNAPGDIFVSSEGCPGLFHITTTNEPTVNFVKLAGNLLDVVYLHDHVILSLDNIHEPGSTTNVQTDESIKPRLIALKRSANEQGASAWSEDDHLNRILTDLNQQTTVSWHEKALQSLLYNTEQLRKRGNESEDM